MVLLSIIIPCFNEEMYLRQCLESILNQNEHLFGKIEIIVVNDGSTDNSWNILEFYISQYAGIRLIDTAHNGLATARNIGLLHSLGTYVMFVDSDDWVSSGCLLDILNIILNDKPDIVIGLIDGIQEKGITKEYTDPNITSFKLNESSPKFLLKMHTFGLKIAPSVKYIFRKSIVDDNQLLFTNVLHEDQLWSPKLLCYAKSYKLYPKYFYKYRLHNDGLSANKSLAVANDYLVIANSLFSIAEKFIMEKQQFLYQRCGYLLNKIHKYSLNYTSEEIKTLNELLNQNYSLISFCDSYLHSDKK